MRIQAFTIALLAAIAFSGSAHATLIATEEAIEGSTRTISLPANEQGVIVTKACPSCAAIVLRMTAATRLMVGKTPVSLAQLQKYVATGGAHNLVVLYDPRQHTLTRILITGKLPAPPR